MRSKKALVVDDDDDISGLIGGVLVDEGYTVKEAGNGVEALEALDQESFDIVLTDLSMPLMDGIDLIMQMRSSLRLKGVPVVVISGALTDERLKRLDSFRICHIMEKPFSIEDVLEKLETVTAKPLLPIDYQPDIRGLLKDASSDILGFYVGEGLVYKTPNVDLEYSAPFAVSSMIPLYGRRIYGSLSLSCSNEFVKVMAERLFDVKDEEIPLPLQTEIVCELANQIAGQFKTILANCSLYTTIGLPEPILSNERYHHKVSTPRLQLPVEFAGAKAAVELAVGREFTDRALSDDPNFEIFVWGDKAA